MRNMRTNSIRRWIGYGFGIQHSTSHKACNIHINNVRCGRIKGRSIWRWLPSTWAWPAWHGDGIAFAAIEWGERLCRSTQTEAWNVKIHAKRKYVCVLMQAVSVMSVWPIAVLAFGPAMHWPIPSMAPATRHSVCVYRYRVYTFNAPQFHGVREHAQRLGQTFLFYYCFGCRNKRGTAGCCWCMRYRRQPENVHFWKGVAET